MNNHMTSSNIENNSNKNKNRTKWFSNITILRESQIMKIHYFTGVGALL